jgi:hypothetical protein
MCRQEMKTSSERADGQTSSSQRHVLVSNARQIPLTTGSVYLNDSAGGVEPNVNTFLILALPATSRDPFIEYGTHIEGLQIKWCFSLLHRRDP